jgi:hypothetical protein
MAEMMAQAESLPCFTMIFNNPTAKLCQAIVYLCDWLMVFKWSVLMGHKFMAREHATCFYHIKMMA